MYLKFCFSMRFRFREKKSLITNTYRESSKNRILYLVSTGKHKGQRND